TELKVTITVEAQVKVTNREYNKSLEDLSSKYSQEIQAQFKKQMKDVYSAVPGYHDVEILGMRNGSVIVDHKVIFQAQIENNEKMIQQQMTNITEGVRNSLAEIQSDEHCSRDSGPELCFVPLPNSILNSSYSFNGTCKNITDPKYADYYYPHIIEGTVHCISRCFKGAQDYMNCFNGVCQVSEIGPHCICNNSDVFWYLGSSCQMPVQKAALGLGLALSVLFVVSTILTVFLIRNKQKKSKKRWFDDAEVWYGQETEEQWIPSSSLTIMNKSAVSSWNEHQKQNEILKPSFSSVDTSIKKPARATNYRFPAETLSASFSSVAEMN
ncbi:mucin-17-like, partial [Pseudonaja textilis]|uniref:mucin-17-like n=1 Tax=Pseudonaja textilis TaxID=8673 RepID=UPI000EA9E792